MKKMLITYGRAFIAFFVGICANPKVCARKLHLCVTEHLCLEIPQKKQRRLPFFVIPARC